MLRHIVWRWQFRVGLYAYDFIAKPFDRKLLINRMRLLLNFKARYDILSADKNAAEHSLISLFDLSSFLAVVLTKDLTVKYCNRQAIDYLKAGPEEILGRSFLALLPDEKRSSISQIYQSVLQ
jgi:PAS domain-containing protein